MLGKGQKLPDEDEVMRHVSWARLKKDENLNVYGFLPSAFDDPQGCSVNWLQYFEGDRETKITRSVEMFRATRNVRPKHAFGIAAVKKIKDVCDEFGVSVKVVYLPEDSNKSHAEIQRIPSESFELLATLADEAFVTLVKNADIPGA